MDKKKLQPIEITELFLIKADWKRTFIGTIEHYTNPDGSKYVKGKVTVNNYQVVSMASDVEEVGKFLDEMVILILDYNLHLIPAVKYSIEGTDLFLN
jgi:hypothetical protein